MVEALYYIAPLFSLHGNQALIVIALITNFPCLYLMMFMDVVHHRSSTLVSSVEVMTTLKPFCSDVTKPATVRSAILLLAEKVNFW